MESQRKMINSESRRMSTKSVGGNQSRPSSRLSSVASYTLEEPDIMIHGKKVDAIPSIPQRDLESLRKSWNDYDPPEHTKFNINPLPSVGRMSSASKPSPRPSVETIRPSAATTPNVQRASSLTSHQPLSGRRRSTFLDKSEDVELREKRERQYHLIEIDKLMQQYGWIHVADDVESWPLVDLKDLHENLQLEVNSNESSSIYSLGLFAATGLVWFVFSKFFKYKYSFNLACILVGSFHKFKPYIMQLSRKGKGKTFYTDWHPGLKLGLQFGMTIAVSVVVMWAVTSFMSKEEKPEVTQERVNEIETLLINYDRHPKDTSGQLNVQALFFEGFKSLFSSKGGDTQKDAPTEAEEDMDNELNSFLD